MRLIDALTHLLGSSGDDPATGLAHRDRSLSHALLLLGGVFLAIGVLLAVVLYT